MKKTFFLFLYLVNLFSEYCIIFVHIGNNIPIYTKVAIEQAQLFNPDARIILLGNELSLNKFSNLQNINNIELVFQLIVVNLLHFINNSDLISNIDNSELIININNSELVF